ncbi:MAG: DUF4430 domain-containing protein, partial [Fastidiosipila sp.]|nr:DUF4430 domain-containing protein [Fastidiosipila sp.]
MKQFKNKKILAFLLIFAIVIGINAPLALANENDEFSVVISIEGLTLGQEIYNGPTEYKISEINDLLADEGYGPYTEENLTAAAATLAFAKDHGLEMDHWGTADNNFYLSAVKNLDTGVLDIPQVITDNGGPSNDNHSGNDDEWLGEFDYNGMSGWMITVNNSMIDVGAADLIFSEFEQDYGNTYV